jgi:hypothetical protein
MKQRKVIFSSVKHSCTLVEGSARISRPESDLAFVIAWQFEHHAGTSQTHIYSQIQLDCCSYDIIRDFMHLHGLAAAKKRRLSEQQVAGAEAIAAR